VASSPNTEPTTGAPSTAVPPPDGWTIAEAASALLPKLYEVASEPPPPLWEMARADLRLAFRRLMESSEYVAHGFEPAHDHLSDIPRLLWRVAEFSLGLYGEIVPPDTVRAGARSWRGVRIVVAGAKHDSMYAAALSAPALPVATTRAEATPNRGGNPGREDWNEFDRQMMRVVGLDGGNLKLRAFKKTMKEWAELNMKPPPDERTVERRIADKVPSEIFAPE